MPPSIWFTAPGTPFWSKRHLGLNLAAGRCRRKTLERSQVAGTSRRVVHDDGVRSRIGRIAGERIVARGNRD